jgi:hypothetical protein
VATKTVSGTSLNTHFVMRGLLLSVSLEPHTQRPST